MEMTKDMAKEFKATVVTLGARGKDTNLLGHGKMKARDTTIGAVDHIMEKARQ